MKIPESIAKIRDYLCDVFMLYRQHPLDRPDPIEGYYKGFSDGFTLAVERAEKLVNAAEKSLTYWDCPYCTMISPTDNVPCECQILSEIQDEGKKELAKALEEWRKE